MAASVWIISTGTGEFGSAPPWTWILTALTIPAVTVPVRPSGLPMATAS